MTDANVTSEAGAGAEALLGLAAQAGQAVRLPSFPALAKQPSTHSQFLPTPPSLPHLTQPQTLQPQPLQPQSHTQTQPQSQAQTQPLATPMRASAAPLPPPSGISRERLPTLSEWADPSFRPFPQPMLAPVQDRWQPSAPAPPNPSHQPHPPHPSQYPYHNPWPSYSYPTPYPYYYQPQSIPYQPEPPQHSVAPVPPPLAVPTQPVVPPLRVPMHTDPVRDAAASNETAAFPPVPQPRSSSSRDPLLERLTSEASAAAMKKTSSRARGLADLMNPTDTMPGASDGPGQTRMEMPVVKLESIEQRVTPVTVPSLPSAEPKLTEIVKEKSKRTKLDLSTIVGVAAETTATDPPDKTEPQSSEKLSQGAPAGEEGAKVDTRAKGETKLEDVSSFRHKEPIDEVDATMTAGNDMPTRPDEKTKEDEASVHQAAVKKPEDLRIRDDDLGSDAGMQEDDENSVENEEVENSDEETRCPCGSEANSGTMIACDQCNTWQHSRCMGFRRSSEVPEKYFCHICRPGDIRPNCIAHPKYRDRSGRERNSLDRREFEAQFAAVKPIELRKLFVCDMRHKKNLMRTKGEVFSRYARHLENQFSKHRTSLIDGLMVLLDMPRQDVVEKLEATLRRFREEKPDDLDRKRSGMTPSNEISLSDGGTSRTPGGGRAQTQKRARPSSLITEGLEGTNGARADATEVMSDFDLGPDAIHGRNMSREERKLQQTMKLFARMEEREREKKKPRTGDAGSSPKTGPPSRSRTPKPTNTRATSPKSSATAADSEEPSRKGNGNKEQAQERTESSEQKQSITTRTGEAELPGESKKGDDTATPKILQPFPQQRSSVASKTDIDASKKEREPRKERVERSAPRRKESCSPDNVNGSTSGRRRNILARERSHEGKRRRTGTSRESERRNSTSKEPLPKYSDHESSPVLPGPSVIGSRMITKTGLSMLEREVREEEELISKNGPGGVPACPNKKEFLLEDARREAMRKFLNGNRNPSPMKKRYRIGDELREEESDVERDEEPECSQPDEKLQVNGKASETLSVSMVVVSEKGSLPDRGQFLESTRLILPGANGKVEEAKVAEPNSAKSTCLKKRLVMVTGNHEATGSESPKTFVKPDAVASKSAVPDSASPKAHSPSSPSTHKSPQSPQLRVSSPKLRSSPPPVFKGPSFRSVPVDGVTPRVRSPSPLPSFRSQKASPSPLKRESQSPELERKLTEDASKLADSSSPVAKDAGQSRQIGDVDSSAGAGRVGVNIKSPEEHAPRISVSKATSSPKNSQSSNAPPPLRSIRSVPPVAPKRVEPAAMKTQSKEPEERENREAESSGKASTAKRSATGETISDIFQQRLQGFLRPGASPSSSPRGPGPKHGLPSLSSPRANTSHLSIEPAASGFRGSSAKPSSAMPPNSKPNLDGLRSSNGLSPTVSGEGYVYQRSFGPNYRGKPADADRSWNPVPSFSSLKRQHSFGRGSRGASYMRGKPGSFSGVERGRHGHGRDGIYSYGRDDTLDKTRSGYRRDDHFPAGRDDDHNSNAYGWSRSYAQRHGWGGHGPGYHSSGNGSGRGSRRHQGT